MKDETQSYESLKREFVRAWTSFSRMKNETTGANALELGCAVCSHEEASDSDEEQLRALVREVSAWLRWRAKWEETESE